MPQDHDNALRNLGIPPEATAERIKRSYRRLVKMYHPDRCLSGSEAHAEAEKKIREINIAYGVLSKPLSRPKYDAKLNKRPTSYSEAEPEHCARCVKPTGYWDTVNRAARCHACTGPIL
jgi:DnaJ-class molecular chaperone